MAYVLPEFTNFAFLNMTIFSVGRRLEKVARRETSGRGIKQDRVGDAERLETQYLRKFCRSFRAGRH
jgi:hypothetical protein